MEIQVVENININERLAQATKFRPDNAEEPTRMKRTSWGSIQTALQDRILPNELYEDDSGEYELTAYQITIFMLAEGEIFGKKLSDVTNNIRTQKDIEKVGGVIVAQTAGSDEFYIDEFEFQSIVGGAGPIATRFSFTIRSPFQADYLDHIFKAAQLLGIRNHNDIPFFVLIGWNGRHTATSEVKIFETARCFSFRVINAALTYDDSGGVYEIDAIRYAEHNFNTSYASLLEDITISGATVIEMMKDLLIRLGSAYSRAVDNVIMPDVFRIDLDEEVAAWKMIKPKESTRSDVKTAPNLTDVDKTIKDILGTNAPVVAAVMSARSDAISKEVSSTHISQASYIKTATYKAGHSIPAIMEDIINATEEMQKLATALKDPQGDDAHKQEADPKKIKRFHIRFDAEVELLAYDGNKQQYACKRIYKIRKHLDPELANDWAATAQSKPLSMARLSETLQAGLLQKAYPYYYTGLNTEIKSLNFKFDNHWINAIELYSKMGGIQKRTPGIIADTIAKGLTDTKLNKLRELTDRQIEDLQGEIEIVDKRLDAERGLGYGGGREAEREKERREHMNSEKKKLEDAVKLLEQHVGVTAAQTAAVKAGKLQPIFEGSHTYDADELIMASGNVYFIENRPKFEGIVYMGSLQKKDNIGVMFPVPQIASVIPKKNTGMRDEYHRGNTILAEIIAKRSGSDMISIELEIRGDPYWIPETFDKPNKNSVSPHWQQPFLIIIASQTQDYDEAGIFQVNERSSLNAVYNVITVQNRFSGGEFTQVLDCKRDMTIDLNTVIRKPDEYHATWLIDSII